MCAALALSVHPLPFAEPLPALVPRLAQMLPPQHLLQLRPLHARPRDENTGTRVCLHVQEHHQLRSEMILIWLCKFRHIILAQFFWCGKFLTTTEAPFTCARSCGMNIILNVAAYIDGCSMISVQLALTHVRLCLYGCRFIRTLR